MDFFLFLKKHLTTFFIINLVVLLAAFAFEDNFIYQKVKDNRHDGISYDSRSNNPEKARVKSFSETDSTFKKVDISFRMKVYSMGKYDNVFQTAQANDGIRLELSAPSTLALIVLRKGDRDPVGITLTNSLTLNKWYQVKINVDQKNRPEVVLNGNVVVDRDNKDAGTFDYKVSDIAVGSGFSKTRNFDGEISNFALHYRFSKKDAVMATLFLAVKIICLILLAGFIILYLKKTRVPGSIRNNVLFLHFFINSLGLLKIIDAISRKISVAYLPRRDVVFNKWVLGLGLYVPTKPAQMLWYFLTIVALFLYYSCFYFIIYKRKTALENRFVTHISRNSARLFIYLAFLVAANLFIVHFNRYFSSSYYVILQVILWLGLLLLPFSSVGALHPLNNTDHEVLKETTPKPSVLNGWFGSKYSVFMQAALLVFIVVQLCLMFSSYLRGEILVSNDYMGIPETTRLADGDYVNNPEYINKYNIGGLRLYIPGAEKSDFPDKYGPGSNGGSSSRGFARKSYSYEQLDFIKKNQYELNRQTFCGWFMHHQNPMLSAINEYSLRGKATEIDNQYGWFNAIFLANLMDITGGKTFQNYIRNLYLFYLLYFILIIGAAFILFRKIQYVLLTALLSFTSLNLLGFEMIHLSPGFNPIRHFFDVVIPVLLFLYLRRKRFIYLILSLAISILAILSCKEFGLFLAAALFIVLIFKKINEHAAKIDKEGISAAVTLLGIGALFYCFKLGANPAGNYYLKGISGPMMDNHLMYSVFILISFIYVIILSRIKVESALAYVALLLFIYGQAIFVYYVWNAAPNHLYAMASPILFMAVIILKIMIDAVARMKKYENVIISALSIALFFTLYLPSLKDYHLAENNFKKIFVDHKIYQWDFPTAKFKSTMNPAYFYNAVSLIKKYSSGTDSIYMVSKYDTILPFLAGKYSAMPFDDVATSLATGRETELCINTIIKDRPQYLFVDSDIERDLRGDIVDPRDPVIGVMYGGSLERVQMLEELRKVFEGVKKEYTIIDRGDILSIYANIKSRAQLK